MKGNLYLGKHIHISRSGYQTRRSPDFARFHCFYLYDLPRAFYSGYPKHMHKKWLLANCYSKVEYLATLAKEKHSNSKGRIALNHSFFTSALHSRNSCSLIPTYLRSHIHPPKALKRSFVCSVEDLNKNQSLLKPKGMLM